jgi:glycosyltransferase involved in cell wall biosynthesis
MGGLVDRGVGRVVLAATKPIEITDGEMHDGLVLLPPPRWPTLGPLWLNTTVPRLSLAHGLDVWIGSLAILPVRNPVPAVAMVHDLTPRTHPTRHTLANRIVFRLFLERSLRGAHTVVAGSAATEVEITDAFPWSSPKLRRIGYGVDEWFSPAPGGTGGRETRDRFAGGRRYILHLGTIEPRKGVPNLVAAWERLVADRGDAPDLVIAGKPGWKTEPVFERIRSSPRAGRVHLPGYVSRRDARELLRHAEVFALASEVEGFGLPLAEAISCGTPAVASDIPALREAGGDAAIFCAPGEPAALAAALVAALDPSTADRLRELARRRAPELRWGPVVDAWAELVREVVAERRD